MSYETKIIETIELPIIGAESGPNIIVEYTGLGLKDASVSDDVVVEVSVYLPSKGGILNSRTGVWQTANLFR